jgi:hypothetical protein
MNRVVATEVSSRALCPGSIYPLAPGICGTLDPRDKPWGDIVLRSGAMTPDAAASGAATKPWKAPIIDGVFQDCLS